MKKRFPVKAFLFTFLFILLLGGCRNKADLDANGVPSTLLIGVYAGDNPGEQGKILERVRQYLQKQLGMKVELTISTDYTSVIQAMLTNKVHIAYLSPFSYVLATQKKPLVPLAMIGVKGQPFMYRSVLITSPASGLRTMDDVRARAKSLTICFADPASTSGHLIPRAYLTSIGLDPQNAFKETLFAGSHAASVMTVKSGKVDVGCTMELALNMLSARGMIKDQDIVRLWTSDPIVEGCITARTDINTEFAGKVRQAYLDLPEKAPDIWKGYLSLYHLNQTDLSYMPAQDSLYNGLRKIAGGIKDLDFNKKGH
ncbi:MAG: phosphate/phosphite/phosphonate ABC transporter substrate-binding protein [Puia sp.]|nr:phosphate/phosphite/phosphonate ABC transporter substrate-binding protein [Puia sp.]